MAGITLDFVFIIQDITELREMENDVKQQKKLLQESAELQKILQCFFDYAPCLMVLTF